MSDKTEERWQRVWVVLIIVFIVFTIWANYETPAQKEQQRQQMLEEIRKIPIPPPDNPFDCGPGEVWDVDSQFCMNLDYP